MFKDAASFRALPTFSLCISYHSAVAVSILMQVKVIKVLSRTETRQISLFHRVFRFIKFYSYQLMYFLIQICIGLLSYIKST